MRAMASQITSLTVWLLKCLFNRRSKKTPKLRVTGLCEGIHRWPVNSPHKGPVMRKMFPFDDVIVVSVSGTIKDECINTQSAATYCEISSAIVNYVTWSTKDHWTREKHGGIHVQLYHRHCGYRWPLDPLDACLSANMTGCRGVLLKAISQISSRYPTLQCVLKLHFNPYHTLHLYYRGQLVDIIYSNLPSEYQLLVMLSWKWVS